MMMNIYQNSMLDHAQNETFVGTCENATHHAHLHNRLCGDDVALSAVIKNGVIETIRFQTNGCSICKASSSILCETLNGQSVSEARDFTAQITTAINDKNPENLPQNMAIFASIFATPARVRCVTLPFETITEMLSSS